MDNSPALQVNDLSSEIAEFLSENGKKALAGPKATSQIYVDKDSGEVYSAIYISLVCSVENKSLGLQRIAKEINALSEVGLIHSVLGLGAIDLARQSGKPNQMAMFFFPLVPSSRKAEVDALVKHVPEGGIGECIDVDEFKLPDSEFYAEIYISPHALLREPTSVEQRLEEEIAQYLAVLPKGTKVVAKNLCTIVSLSVPYEVIFSNPIMKDFKKVELLYRRACAVVGDKLEQFNLLTGVKYTKKDGSVVE